MAQLTGQKEENAMYCPLSVVRSRVRLEVFMSYKKGLSLEVRYQDDELNSDDLWEHGRWVPALDHQVAPGDAEKLVIEIDRVLRGEEPKELQMASKWIALRRINDLETPYAFCVGSTWVKLRGSEAERLMDLLERYFDLRVRPVAT